MTILVTGAAGFIGTYMVNELLSQNINVIASDRNIDKAKQCDWFDKVQFELCDISNVTNENLDVFKKADKVIHLAWEGLPNYKELFHFERNLPIQYAFIKSLVEIGINDVCISGTCFEYGLKEGGLSVDMLPDPHNAYALAKDTLRKFLQELQKTKSFKLKWARLFYTYGKGQSGNSLLSQLETAVSKNEEFFNMSGGEQIRDYLPIEKLVEKMVSISLDNNLDGILNCCSGNPITVKKLVEDYIERNNYKIKLNLGYYPYPDYEPMAFWGVN